MVKKTDVIQPLANEQKLEVLKKFLEEGNRLHFSDAISPVEKEQLTQNLVSLLLSDEKLCGKCLTNGIHFRFFPGDILPEGIPPYCLESEDEDIFISVPMGSSNVAQIIHRTADAAINTQKDKEEEQDAGLPLSAKADQVNGYDLIAGSGLDDEGHSSVNPDRVGRRGQRYDPKADTLREGLAHTWGDLIRNGKARAGLDPGGEFLRRMEYNYVMSDEALASKTPHRWFRDLCVVCGVSTPTLYHLIGGGQNAWSAFQNKGVQIFSKKLFQALGHVNPIPVHCGKGKGYYLPSGSLFDFKTIEIRNGSRTEMIVDPAVLDRLSRALFKRPYFGKEQVESSFTGLSHLAGAYLKGAVAKEDLQASSIPIKPLHDILVYYGFGRDEVSSFLKGHEMNIEPTIDRLRAVNNEHWHIEPPVFEQYIKKLHFFPTGTAFKKSTMLPEEAFIYAQHHHDGRIGGFLRSYREAMGNTMGDLQEYSTEFATSERIRQMELITTDNTVRDRALKSNFWQLPVDHEGNIQPYVKEYLYHFDKHKYLPPPESHWLTPLEACEQFTGLDGDAPIKKSAIIERLERAIADGLKSSPETFYPLITLPGGKQALVKITPGQPPRLLDSEIREWILAQVHTPAESWKARTANSLPLEGGGLGRG